MINECLFPQMNDCHPSAECIDKPDGFTCKCRPGFKEVSQQPGRDCKQRKCRDGEI